MVVGEDTAVGVGEHSDTVRVGERTRVGVGEQTRVGVGDGEAAAFGAMLCHLERQEGRQGGAAQG